MIPNEENSYTSWRSEKADSGSGTCGASTLKHAASLMVVGVEHSGAFQE